VPRGARFVVELPAAPPPESAHSALARERSGVMGPPPFDDAQGVLSEVERTRATEPGCGAEPHKS